MASQSQAKNKKGAQYQHKGHSLTRNSAKTAQCIFSFAPPNRRTNFLGGAAWHLAEHKGTETS